MEKEKSKQCWLTIGINGDRSCHDLAQHIHCRNCPRFEAAGRSLLDRPIPEDYLNELTSLTARPESRESAGNISVMVFMLGGEWLALPATIFLEITPPRPIRRIPHRSNAVFLGLTSIRGDILLCYSAAALLGIEKNGNVSSLAHLRRFCVIGRNGKKFVFPVDEAFGLCKYDESAIQPVPVTLALAKKTYTSAIVSINNRQTGIINADLFLGAFERSLT